MASTYPTTGQDIYRERRTGDHALFIEDDMRGMSPEERLLKAQEEAKEIHRIMVARLFGHTGEGSGQ